MKTNSINSNSSFKQRYLVKGHTDLLDELCWYAQKRKQKNLGFDFVDIRNGIWFPGEINPSTHEAVDLFMTADEKEFIEPKMRDLVTESVFERYKTAQNESLAGAIDKTDGNMISLLAKNLAEMLKNLSSGKPIVNIQSDLIKKFDPFLKLVTPEPLDGEKVFEGLQRDKFDITEGILV